MSPWRRSIKIISGTWANYYSIFSYTNCFNHAGLFALNGLICYTKYNRLRFNTVRNPFSWKLARLMIWNTIRFYTNLIIFLNILATWIDAYPPIVAIKNTENKLKDVLFILFLLIFINLSEGFLKFRRKQLE